MHHYVQPKSFPGSYCLISDAPHVDRAVLFVHGFLGNATDTWVDFQGLGPSLPSFSSADLFFLRYNSFKMSVSEAADLVADFLREIYDERPEWLDLSKRLPDWVPLAHGEDPMVRLEPASYRHLTLVGHSLGGVVLRQLVLNALALVAQAGANTRQATVESVSHSESGRLATQRSPAIDDVGTRIVDVAPHYAAILPAKLVLFAPALFGARPAGLFGLLLRFGGIGMLARALLGMSKSYGEIQQGSDLLKYVRDTTDRMARESPDVSALRASVLWPETDSILVDSQYFADVKAPRAKGKDHVSVCKPSADYLTPIELLVHGSI